MLKKIGLFARIKRMLTYLRRWQVANSLYHLQRKRDHSRWVQENDLCAYISGADIENHRGEDTCLMLIRAWIARKLFWGARNHDELYQEIRNTILDCEDEDIKWIRKYYDNNAISHYLNLTTRGREVYPYSHLIGLFFGNYWVKWGFGIFFSYLIAHRLIQINF